MTRNPDPVLAEQYRTMAVDCGLFCWRCGRTPLDRPAWWNAPWVMHRAHICHSPRVEDRRVVAILCPVCHSLQHGHIFNRLPDAQPLSIAELLGLKRKHDLAFYDRAFMQKYSIGRLPRAVVLSESRLRQGVLE